jgi:hypothetical protein
MVSDEIVWRMPWDTWTNLTERQTTKQPMAIGAITPITRFIRKISIVNGFVFFYKPSYD